MVRWPDSASSKLAHSKPQFLQMAEGFAWLNPHVTIEIDWEDEKSQIEATDPNWNKWRPSDPTSPHWYTDERIIRLMGAYIARDREKAVSRAPSGISSPNSAACRVRRSRSSYSTKSTPRV